MSLISRLLFYEHLLAMQFPFFHEQLEGHVSQNSFKTIMIENHVHYSKRVRYRAISTQSWMVSAVNLIHCHCALDKMKAPYVVNEHLSHRSWGTKRHSNASNFKVCTPDVPLFHLQLYVLFEEYTLLLLHWLLLYINHQDLVFPKDW